MVLELVPLTNEPELYEEGVIDGMVCTQQTHVLLSTESSSGISNDLFLTTDKIPNTATNQLHYAGSEGGLMNFYTMKRSLFGKKYLLAQWNPHEQEFIMLDRTDQNNSSSMNFFHRQPYYLLQTSSLLSSSWSVRSFNANDSAIQVNLAGVAMKLLLVNKNYVLINKNQKVFILSKGNNDYRASHGNVVVIQHPHLDTKCTAYTDPYSSLIYVSCSTCPKLFIIDSDTLSIETAELPRILDIRYANEDTLIFVDTQQNVLNGLYVIHLPDRYWRSKLQFEAEIDEAWNDWDDMNKQIEELTLAATTSQSALDNEKEKLKKEVEKGKARKADIAILLNKIAQMKKERTTAQGQSNAPTKLDAETAQLRKQVATLQRELDFERQKAEKQLLRASKEQQNFATKEMEYRQQVAGLKQECASNAAQKTAWDIDLAFVQYQRDVLVVQKKELGRKYSRMLMLFGRNRLPAHMASPSEETEGILELNDQPEMAGIASIKTTLGKKKRQLAKQELLAL